MPDDLEAELNAIATQAAFSGVVRVEGPDRPLLERAYGLADRRHGIPNEVRTRFGIASGTKSLTALTVVSLIEDGLVELSRTARSLLGDELPLIADERFALVFDAHGTMLRIAKMNDFSARPGTVVGWRVEDVRAMVVALTIMGVTFERYPGMPQDEWGVMTFPERSKVAWFKDPDGNTLSLTEFPQSTG